MQGLHPAILYEKRKKGGASLRCRQCSHYCIIDEGGAGECLTRINMDGRLYTTNYGAAQSAAVDPIEKKPFYHFTPGASVLSFGAPGCNFRCLNCQNYSLSHAYKLGLSENRRRLLPEDIVRAAVDRGVAGISYTYSEPAIFFEYARDTILLAKKTAGADAMTHSFVSNGYFSKEALDLIEKEELIDAVNIDLKFMDDKKYREICGARLRPVLYTIGRIAELNETIHLEITNLVIPGENDSDDDFKRLAEFISSVSPDIPLHFSRFYPQFKMTDRPATSLQKLERARETAIAVGIKYVYIGNAEIPGAQDTLCSECGKLLIARSRYGISKNVFKGVKDRRGTKCPECGSLINMVL